MTVSQYERQFWDTMSLTQTGKKIYLKVVSIFKQLLRITTADMIENPGKVLYKVSVMVGSTGV